MKFIKSKKGLALLAVLVVGAIATAGAIAYWTQAGKGTGSAALANPGNENSANAVAISGSTLNDLYPGGLQAVTTTLDNPNPWRVKVDQVNVDITVDAGHSALCDAADFSYIGDDTGSTTGNDLFSGNASGGFVAASSSATFTGSVSMEDTTANQDGCKGATLTLTYSTDNSAG